MTRKCWLCGQFWAFNSGRIEDFVVVTQICPECIPDILPVYGRPVTA